MISRMLLLPTILLLCCARSYASPLQARAAATAYVYMAATTVPSLEATTTGAVFCPEGIFDSEYTCPSGCIAAPCAGALGIVTTKWKCDAVVPSTIWTSYEAMSTCEAGSAVTTYTRWGGQTQLGCKATDG